MSSSASDPKNTWPLPFEKPSVKTVPSVPAKTVPTPEPSAPIPAPTPEPPVADPVPAGT